MYLKIRCDMKSWKVFKFWVEVKKGPSFGMKLWARGGGRPKRTTALFRCVKILDFATVIFSFVCGKYYPIMDYLGSKDSSRDL